MKCPRCNSIESFRLDSWHTECAEYYYCYDSQSKLWDLDTVKVYDTIDSGITTFGEAVCLSCRYVGSPEEFNDGNMPNVIRPAPVDLPASELIKMAWKSLWKNFRSYLYQSLPKLFHKTES